MTYIKKLDGTVIDLDELGIRTIEININSPNLVNHYEIADGRAALIDYGTSQGARSIDATFRVISHDRIDVSLQRDEIFDIFSDREAFYLIEKRVPSKQRLVKVEGYFGLDNRALHSRFTVSMIAIVPYAESTYTTLELHDSGIDSAAEKYGLVDDIDSDKVKYRFTENEFTVYNAGNVTVEPESMVLTIQLTGATSNGDLSLKNLTTGEEFKLTKNISERNIRLEGMNIYNGSVNAFRDTNRRLISIAPGDNIFEITGATFSEIWFRFKYYYK